MMLRCCLKIVLVWALIACHQGSGAAQLPFPAQFHVVPPKASGIDFVHTNGGTGEMFITETVMGGLATFDYDDDGLVDIYFVNGASIKAGAPVATNRLYRNLGNLRFADVTEQAGVAHPGCGMGAVTGDFDNDSDIDLFVTNYGDNVFYVNNGDGTFRDATQESGLSTGTRFGAGSALVDIDGDGNLDLYTASYVEFAIADHKTNTVAGYKFPPGPNDYPPARDYLFRSRGDGTFEDISEPSGIASLKAPGMGVVAADFDADGDADIWVANDQQLNYLLLNDGNGNFEEQGLLAGLAVDVGGRANGNMGAAVADLNSDGQLDLVTTTYQEEMPVVYLAVAPGIFEDATNRVRLDRQLYNHVSWGCNLVDFDNDGDRDIFLACGHFLENLRFIDDRTTVDTPNYLLANDGTGRFANVSGTSGPGLLIRASSRGSAAEDFDNDGDMDLLIVNDNASPSLLRNDLHSASSHVHLRLVGTECNRESVGAVVTLQTSNASQVGVQLAGSGYESSYGRRMHFAYKGNSATIIVTWPGGIREQFTTSSEEPSPSIVQGAGTKLLLQQ